MPEGYTRSEPAGRGMIVSGLYSDMGNDSWIVVGGMGIEDCGLWIVVGGMWIGDCGW